MKTNNSIINNVVRLVSVVLLLFAGVVNVWGTALTTSDLNFGTPAISYDFNSVTGVPKSKNGNTSAADYGTSLSGYGGITSYWFSKSTSCYVAVKSSATPMTSQYLELQTDGTKVSIAGFERTFATKGAYSFLIAKTSVGMVGLYATGAGISDAKVYTKSDCSVYLKFTGSKIQINDGSSGWVDAVGTTDFSALSSTFEVTVIYNNTNSADTYNSGNTTLAAKRAHIFVNGTAVMNGTGTAPKDFTIPGAALTGFRLAYGDATTTIKLDDIKIYDTWPTQAGDAITLDKNNTDLSGSTSGSAVIVADATSMSSISAPTRIGYDVEGYYTSANCTTKIATNLGALQKSITVDAITWTNGSSQWKKGGAATFYTNWTPKDYTVTLNDNGGSGGSESVTVTYKDNANMTTAVAIPTKKHHIFGGYWTSNNSGATLTTQVIDDEGEWITSVSGYTDATPKWIYDGDVTLYAKWTEHTYANYRTVCPSELTLTGPTGDLVFITSTANKTVRSQEAFHVEGSGLTRSQTLSFDFGSDALNDKFTFKKANGSAVSTDAAGAVDEDIYVFYTPGSVDTSDDIDIVESVTASVTGVKAEESTLDTKTIIGRHLPANFVIAGKKEDNKWYAMPANMSSTTNPKPSEIIVDDINNPSLAYTAASNIYNMEGPTASNISGSKGDYIRFVMTPLWVDDEDHSKGHAPLFGRATSNNEIGKSGDSQATSDLNSGGWWWKLVQTNTSITNPQDAKYTIYNHNNTSSLSLRDNAGNPDWGLFASGVSELRLIPAQTADVVEAYFVEWGTNGGVIEVDAEDISATKVKAKFKGSSSTKSLSQTLTSGGKASKYDYTVAFDGIDLSAADAVGNILLLEWYEEDDDLAGVTSISVPKIISGNYTMMGDGKPSKTDWEGYDEVHVLPSAKLTANTAGMSGYGMTLKHLEIYQGATVIITSGSNKGTLTVTDLVLRNGWSRAGSKRYDVARLYIKPYESDSKKASSLVATNAYADWYIDFDQYYPIAVPWDVTIPSGLSYRYCTVSATVGHDNNIRLRYYDGEGRAAGTNAGTSNWKDYGKGDNKAMPAKLVPAQGYVMSAKRPTGKAFSIIRMTLTIPSATWTADGEQEEVSGTHKNQVSVGAWGKDDASKPWYAKCWNYIANPYMAVFTDDRKDDSNLVGKLLYENGGSVRYATIPDADFKGFNQVNINEAELKPSSGFLVQVASTCTLTFSNSEIAAPSAPMRYTANQEAIPEQEAYIRLSGENGDDQMGLVIGSDYTADYEINADLSKMIGEANIVKTWMQYTNIDMAYVAINEQLAREWIPVTVHIPADGEYTYSMMNSSTVDELEGVYLTDYLTGLTTNLLYNDYTFSAEAGTNTERFAINAIVGERKIPTGADITGVDKNGTEPVKFIWHDKVFILHNNVIYDSTGKRVNVINK